MVKLPLLCACRRDEYAVLRVRNARELGTNLAVDSWIAYMNPLLSRWCQGKIRDARPGRRRGDGGARPSVVVYAWSERKGRAIETAVDVKACCPWPLPRECGVRPIEAPGIDAFPTSRL